MVYSNNRQRLESKNRHLNTQTIGSGTDSNDRKQLDSEGEVKLVENEQQKMQLDPNNKVVTVVL